jgi:SAM-dependent methyltransferase
MGTLRNLVTPLHQLTARDYIGRMKDEKVHCMSVAREYEESYWDGDRRYGYGGYHYIPGRWESVAQSLIDLYSLNNKSSLLDVGCGTGFLLFEIKRLLPECRVTGFDVSRHGLAKAKQEVKGGLFIHHAATPFPANDNEFDLVISLGCLHNLKLPQLEIALQEIDRVGRAGYLMVESYRNCTELFNLQCWALTAESFLDPEEWRWIYDRCGYSGDYEFIFFE